MHSLIFGSTNFAIFTFKQQNLYLLMGQLKKNSELLIPYSFA